MILAEKVMMLRKKKGWSQEELAEKLDISRQSVSKWESGASVPDIDKIITLSELFGVSTDYLLKDALETERDPVKEIVYEERGIRSVSAEEADDFVKLRRRIAFPTAIGAALCVLSPVPLLLLAALSEYVVTDITEDMAGGWGMVILLVLVAAGVAVLVLSELRLEKYGYLEKEDFMLQYGVSGICEKGREAFAGVYNMAVTVGVVLCILGVIPLMVAVAFSAPDEVYVYCMAVLLVLVAFAVFLIVWAGTVKGSFDMLLQEGDYTAEEKFAKKKLSFFPGAYWCSVTALFLAAGFWGMEWKYGAFIWPIAALLFVTLWCILKGFFKGRFIKSR